MKFLYKIHSGYDGFFPRRIRDRMVKRNILRLGWDRYLDVAEEGTEVWVYFHGPHAFLNGVYVKGFIQSIDTDQRSVFLRVRECSTNAPLTDHEMSQLVAAVVSPRYRQVFLLPEEWALIPKCSIDSTADSCNRRLCDTCPTWAGLPMINPDSYSPPRRLPDSISDFVPAYWVIPSRCYLGQRIGRRVRNTSELFYRFKIGEAALAFPLAFGIFQRLRRQKLLDFDAIVPIPLSPDKVQRGELHRTALLARELARLLGATVLNILSLKEPCSKKLAMSVGATVKQFEDEYYEKLVLEASRNIPDRILVIDDVCTRGSTLRIACRKIVEVNPECHIVAASVGQMILKNVVRDEQVLTAN